MTTYWIIMMDNGNVLDIDGQHSRSEGKFSTSIVAHGGF